MMRKILHRMMEGGVEINVIARDLGVERGTINAILEMAVRAGYLEKTSIRSNCSACFLRAMCEVEPSECGKTEMYVLTPKGEKFASFKSRKNGDPI